MFKKLILAAVVAISSLHTASALARSNEDQQTPPGLRQTEEESAMMKAFACFYWECPALYIKYSGWGLIIESFGELKAKYTINKARKDASFFASRVLYTENGKSTSELYLRVVIKLQPGDQVTTMALVREFYGSSYGSSYQRVPVNTQGLTTLDLKDYEATKIEINGRPLISENLKTAHMAMQNLIFDGALPVPDKERFTMATNLMRINQWMVDNGRK